MTEEVDRHAKERVKEPFKTWKDETPAQQAAVHLRRATQALVEHPEWSDERLGEEWGIPAELVEAMRSPQQREKPKAHEQYLETYAERVAAEFKGGNATLERQKAFKRLSEALIRGRRREP